MSLLAVNNLSVRFEQGSKSVDAVKGISFSIDKGQTVALVGESGSGKSVTAHSILQLLPYPLASHPNGEILYNGKDVLQANKAEIRHLRGNQISMIFQEPLTALNPLHTIEKQIAEVINLHQALSAKELRQRVIQLLEDVKIKDPESKLAAYPHQLSGGQRQRVMIAMAIANEPDLLIADEPTTALDVTIQKEILDLLNSIQQKMGMAVLLITHDLGVVKAVADHVLVMKSGEIVEEKTTAELFASPEHDYTKMLLDAEPHGDPVPVSTDTKDVISVSDLRIDYLKNKGSLFKPAQYFTAAQDITISLDKGKTLGIVGESGSGKSSLAMAILRLIDSKGSIQFKQQSIDQLNQKQLVPLRPQMQVVFQDPFGSLSPRMPVSDIISEGLRIHTKLSKQEIDDKVIAIMKEVELDPEVRHRYPHEFSGGQRQRIAIARAIILQPELLVLDEPTSALDRSVQMQIIELLKKLQEKHALTYLFISHDLQVVKSISHEIIVMKAGKIVEQGINEKIFNQPETDYTRQLLDASLSL